MFSNVGEKIMTLAKVSFIIDAIASFICGIASTANEWLFWDELAILNFFVFGVGAVLVFYISTMFLYAFGQLVDDIHKNKESETSNLSDELPSML